MCVTPKISLGEDFYLFMLIQMHTWSLHRGNKQENTKNIAWLFTSKPIFARNRPLILVNFVTAYFISILSTGESWMNAMSKDTRYTLLVQQNDHLHCLANLCHQLNCWIEPCNESPTQSLKPSSPAKCSSFGFILVKIYVNIMP